MRFLTMVKAAEGSGFPPQELMDAIEQLSEEQAKAGVLVEAGGLMPSALGGRVRVTRGRVSVSDGPFTEAKELVGGYAFLEVGSRDEAMEAAKLLMELHIQHWPGWEGEVEVRQVTDGPPPQ